MATITSPIEIQETKMTCDNKCSYKFDYGNADCTVTNNTDHLLLSYKNSTSTVTYNDNPCTVQEVRLYKPSLNNYYGTKADAEIIINHSTNGGNNLLVCVPITASDSKTRSSQMLKPIIQLAPISENDEPANVNISDYTLNNVVPAGAFYNYTGTLPYDDNNGTYDIIIFDNASESSSTILPVSLETLGTIIEPTGSSYNNSFNLNNLFYNKTGTAEPPSGDDIYIDCNLVDSEGNIIEDSENDSSSGSDSGSDFSLSKIFESPWFDTLLGVGIVVLLVYLKKKYQ